jgi:aldose 1-epimerase
LDFTTERAIGDGIPTKLDKGFDHFFVLPQAHDDQMQVAAKVTCPSSGISMSVTTTEPGFQLYTGYYNDIPASLTKSTHDPKFVYGQYSGVCFEAQRFPNAVNQAEWTSSVEITPVEPYRQTTAFTFSLVE